MLQAFKATSDPDIMYLHEDMRELEWKEFVSTVVKEVTYQMDNRR